MRTKNFIKTVKKLISSFFNLPQNSNIEDLTQSDGPLVPIVHYRMTFGEPPSPPVETVGSQPIVSRVWLNGAEVNIEDLDPNIYTQLVGRFVRSSIPSIEVTVEGLQTDLHPVDYDRLLGNQDDPMTPIGFERWKAGCRSAIQKMQSCPYFANSPHLKCTVNPENTNCLECNEYEHHDSNEMDS